MKGKFIRSSPPSIWMCVAFIVVDMNVIFLYPVSLIPKCPMRWSNFISLLIKLTICHLLFIVPHLFLFLIQNLTVTLTKNVFSTSTECGAICNNRTSLNFIIITVWDLFYCTIPRFLQLNWSRLDTLDT